MRERTNRDETEMRPGPIGGRIEEMLRVDHAGEYGAVAIYRGQRAVFDRIPSKTITAAAIAAMEAGEQKHLDAFDRLLAERRARPTLLSPLWSAAGFALGAGSALLGERSAMAATAAVEESIERHYARQADEIEAIEPELAQTFREFREDELGHKHEAEAAGAEDAPAFGLMRRVIQAGCAAAIRISEKI